MNSTASALLSFFIILTIFFSCANGEEEAESPSIYNIPIELLENTKELSKDLDDCFGKSDTSMYRDALGCAAGYYGWISSEYILHISPDIYNNYELESTRCKNYLVNENEIPCELWIFEKGKSHLTNICTDISIVDFPEPIRKLKSTGGSLLVVLDKLDKHAFIKIDSLLFIDSLFENQTIKLENIVLSDVENLGIPG